MNKAIDQALREVAKSRLKKMLDELRRPSSNDENSIAFLLRKRLEWDGRPIDVLEGRDQ